MRSPYSRFRPHLDGLEGRDTPASLYTASGTIAGGAPLVEVAAPGGSLLARFAPFEAGFTGGVRAATGELDGNPGTVEVAVVPGAGGGPRVQVFAVGTADGSVTRVADFLAFESTFRDGLRVAVGRVGGAGNTDQIILGTDLGGGPRVRIVRLEGGQPVTIPDAVGNFFAFEPTFRGGVRVAAANIDGDLGNGDELIVGAGPGGGPRVRVFTSDGTVVQDFFAAPVGSAGSSNGVNVGFDAGSGRLRTDFLADDFSQRNAALNAPILAQLQAARLAAGGSTSVNSFGLGGSGFGRTGGPFDTGLTGLTFSSPLTTGVGVIGTNTVFTGGGGFTNGLFGNSVFNTSGFDTGLFSTGTNTTGSTTDGVRGF